MTKNALFCFKILCYVHLCVFVCVCASSYLPEVTIKTHLSAHALMRSFAIPRWKVFTRSFGGFMAVIKIQGVPENVGARDCRADLFIYLFIFFSSPLITYNIVEVTSFLPLRRGCDIVLLHFCCHVRFNPDRSSTSPAPPPPPPGPPSWTWVTHLVTVSFIRCDSCAPINGGL